MTNPRTVSGMARDYVALLLILVCACLVMSAGAHAQEGDRPRQPTIGETTRSERERLERQLAWLDQRRETILAQLESAGPPKMEAGRGDDRRGGPPFEPPISREEIRQRIQQVVADMDPEFADRVRSVLGTLDNRDGDAEQRMAARVLPKLMELAKLRGRDDEMYQAKLGEFRAGYRIMQASRQLIEGAGQEQFDTTNAETELRAAIASGFEAKVAVTRLEVERLSGKLETLRSDLQESELNRDQLIASQVDRLLARIEEIRQRGENRSGDDRPRRQR